ncbi:MAG: hypothetical protein AAF485_12870 [Chloroflexota bacterium]
MSDKPETVHRWYTANNVSLEALDQALGAMALRWIYAERMETTVLTDFQSWRQDQAVPFTAWRHGRAFSKAQEVAWWRTGNTARVRLITTLADGPANDLSWQADPNPPILMAERNHLLVGQRDPNESSVPPKWSEAEISRYLEYPISGKAARVALIEALYQQEQCLVAKRLVALEAVPI